MNDDLLKYGTDELKDRLDSILEAILIKQYSHGFNAGLEAAEGALGPQEDPDNHIVTDDLQEDDGHYSDWLTIAAQARNEFRSELRLQFESLRERKLK